MKNPGISVVITAYNKGKFIGDTVRSVLSQEYGDFELIIVDDGSTDNTREVVSSFPDKRIRYHYQANSGLPACARNKGMSLSTGRYISLLDGDDYWYNEKLQRSKEVLDDMPDAGLIWHNEAIVHDGRVLRHTSYKPYGDDMYRRLLFEGKCLPVSAVTLRREIFFEGGFKFSEDKRLFAIEDYEYWLRLSRRYRFYFLPEVLGCYRVTEKGAFFASGGGNPVNMLRLLDEHFREIGGKDRKTQEMIRRRRASVMCGAGRMYQHNRQFKESEKWYLAALGENPFDYKALVGLVASLLRIRIIYR
ncbi:MAG: glycosyltransferase [Candidatus Omnitrophica bacterium]|nr:glycosyltransferase [Candidatus Omnitrophota bacterium]